MSPGRQAGSGGGGWRAGQAMPGHPQDQRMKISVTKHKTCRRGMVRFGHSSWTFRAVVLYPRTRRKDFY